MELSPTQIQATKILLGKTIADVTEATLKHQDERRTVASFTDAELEAILRRRVGVVAVESTEQRPDDATVN